MNLRQIIRNQKLQKFDLISLVSEADEDDEVSKKDAFAGKTKAGSSQYWYVNDEGEMKAVVNKPTDGGWELADKEQVKKAKEQGIDTDGEGEEKEKETTDEMSVEERKARADNFANQLNLKPSDEDKNVYIDEDGKPILVFADDGTVLPYDVDDPEEKKWEKAISDFNDSTGAVPKSEPEEEQDEEEQEELSEKDREAIKKINEFLPESIKKADPSIARALHYGYKKVPDKPPKDAGKIWTPAPGNASSLFNETVSMIGAEILKENPEMSKEELEEKLYESLSGTDAWKGVKDKHIDTTIDAAITKHNMTREAMEAARIKPERAKTKSYYGTAESLQNQYDDIMKHKGPFYGGNGEKITSIPTDTETRMFLENFKDPATGEKLSEEAIDNMVNNPKDRDVIQRFLALSAYNGGGGGNPSDTATIISDGKKMQFIAFSDKTSLGDQQANSTPNQLINNFFGTIRILKGDGYEIDPEEEKKMKSVIENKGNEFKDAERNLAKAQTAPFNVLARLLKDKNEVAKEIFNDTFKQPGSNRYKAIDKVLESLTNPAVKGKATKEETLDRNLNDPKGVGVTDKQRDAMIEAGIKPLPTWGYYLKEVNPEWKEGDDITPELTEAAYIARAGDSREFTDPKTDQPTSVGDLLTPGDQQRYISDAIKGLRLAAEEDKIKLEDDDREAVVNQQREIAKYREESVNALNEMHDQLNEFTVENKKGEESRMGDTLMAMDMVRSLHLGMIDEKDAPGLFKSGSVHIVAGEHRTSPEAMRGCLGDVDNIEELVRNTKTRPPEKSGPQLPGRGSMGGLYESELSRSTKEKVTNDKGEKLYIIDGEYSWSPDGEEPEKPKDVSKNDWKKKVQGPLGPITGRKVFAYTLDAEGKEIPVGEMSMRTKGGTTLQTTYTFAKGLKDCLEGKTGSTNESFNALLGSILAEEKINTLAHHWKIAEDDYPVDLFIKELNERSLN